MRHASRFILFLIVSSALPLYAQSSVPELNEAGWKALQAGNSRRALALFNEALTLRPNDPVLLTGAGAALHAEGRPRDAMTRLKQAVSLAPDLTTASVILAQIAYDDGDAALAIKTIENALKHAPGDPVLTSKLGEWKQETKAHSGFQEERYDRFRVMFEGHAEQATAAQAVAILNRAFWRIGEKLGSYPSSTILTILYTEQQFRDITRAPEWSGGQYDGRIRIPVAGAAQKPQLFEEVLVHELTHAILDAIAGGHRPDLAERRPRAVLRRQRSRSGAAPVEGGRPDHAAPLARARFHAVQRAAGAGRIRREPAGGRRHARSSGIRLARAAQQARRRTDVRGGDSRISGFRTKTSKRDSRE